MVMSFSEFIESTRRVLTVAKKPNWDEYKLMLKITLLGIAIIGLLGFLVKLVFTALGLGVLS